MFAYAALPQLAAPILVMVSESPAACCESPSQPNHGRLNLASLLEESVHSRSTRVRGCRKTHVPHRGNERLGGGLGLRRGMQTLSAGGEVGEGGRSRRAEDIRGPFLFSHARGSTSKGGPLSCPSCPIAPWKLSGSLSGYPFWRVQDED